MTGSDVSVYSLEAAAEVMWSSVVSGGSDAPSIGGAAVDDVDAGCGRAPDGSSWGAPIGAAVGSSCADLVDPSLGAGSTGAAGALGSCAKVVGGARTAQRSASSPKWWWPS